MDEEVGKYHKKSHKTIKKSSHKHNYEECLLHDKDGHYSHATYCIECGKIGDVRFFECKQTEGRWRMIMSNEEIYEKYKHLIIFEIDGIYKNKYVKLEEK